MSDSINMLIDDYKGIRIRITIMDNGEVGNIENEIEMMLPGMAGMPSVQL